MPARRIVPIAVAVLALGVLLARITGAGQSGSLLSLEGSGSSQSNSQVAGVQRQGESSTPVEATPTSDASPIGSLDQASVSKQAFILLNPASATAGSAVGVSGSGFDPASVVDFYLTTDPKNDNQLQELGFAQADSGGSFGSFSFSVPQNYRSPTFTVIAKERNSSNRAEATGRLEALRPSVKLGTNVGVVGDNVQISAQGFMPGEEVKVYFNSLSGTAFQTFKASSGGTIEKQSVKIPYGPVGNNSMIFVGSQSQSPVTVPFLMLTLYPNVALSSYALKADTVMAFSGSGFGPDEDVEVHLNNPQAPPIVRFATSRDGTFENAGAFMVPFELTGKNTLIFVGNKSQATVTAGFDVLPYTPNVQPSTYGGRPGTSITFYGDGFARGEVVRFFINRTKDSQGKMISCARADNQGQIGAGGSYTIPPTAQAGKLEFTAIGSRSKTPTTATVQVMEAGMQIQGATESQGDFQCPYDQQEQEAGQQAPRPTAEAVPVPAQPNRSPSQQIQTQGIQAQPGTTPEPRPTAPPKATPEPVRPSASAPAGQPSQGGRNAVVGAGGGSTEMLGDPTNPGTSQGKLDPGAKVELQGDSRTVGGQQWVRVKAGGKEGWLPALSVQVVAQPKPPQPAGQ